MLSKSITKNFLVSLTDTSENLNTSSDLLLNLITDLVEEEFSNLDLVKVEFLGELDNEKEDNS